MPTEPTTVRRAAGTDPDPTARAAVPARGEIVRRARQLRPLISAGAEQSERDRRLCDDSVAAIADAGLWRIFTPRLYGGWEAGLSAQVDAVIELSAAYPAAGWVLMVTNAHSFMIGNFPVACQDEVFGDDPDARIPGTLVAQGEARRAEGGWRVSGRWQFASGIDHGDWVTLGVTCDEPASPELRRVHVVVPKADLELEGHLLADQDAAGLEGCVPVHAPVLAVDGRLAFEPDPGVAERVDGGTAVLEVDGDRLGDTLDRQVARDPVVLVVHALDLRRHEGDLRVGVHVEEVVGAEVAVPVGVAGVDAGGLDRQLQLRRASGSSASKEPRAREVVERTADLGDHGVAGDEADAAVGRVDRVGAGGDGRQVVVSDMVLAPSDLVDTSYNLDDASTIPGYDWIVSDSADGSPSGGGAAWRGFLRMHAR